MRLALILALLWSVGPLPATAGPEAAPKGVPVALPVQAALPFGPPAAPGPGPAPAGPGSLDALPSLEGSLPVLSPESLAPSGSAEDKQEGRAQSTTENLEQAGEDLEQAGSSMPGAETSAAPVLNRVFDAASSKPAALAEPEAGAPSLPQADGAARRSLPAPVSLAAAPEKPQGGGKLSALKPAIPNLITGLNLTSGLGAMMLAAQGAFLPASGLILLAVAFDAMDGRAARALGVASPIGIELDSLADVVSFGAAPAVLIYKAGLASWGPWGFAVAAPFAVAGAYRLARFNLGAQAEKAAPPTEKKSDSFTGLPIPGGAGVIVAATLGLSALPAACLTPVAAGITLLASAAMVSRLPYPAFKKGGLKALVLPGAAALAAAVPLALFGHAALIPAAVFGGYLLTGPLIHLYRSGDPVFRKELKRKAFHQLLMLYIPAFSMMGAARFAPSMAVLTSLIAAAEFVRLRVPAARLFFEKHFEGILREKEKAKVSGSLWAALGIFGAAALYGSHPAIVVASILALALGDAASPLVGMRVHFLPYKAFGTQRSVSGTAAGFAVAFLIAFFAGLSPAAALLAAAAFSAADTFPLKPDDNLWIPLVFSTALYLLGLR